MKELQPPPKGQCAQPPSTSELEGGLNHRGFSPDRSL